MPHSKENSASSELRPTPLSVGQALTVAEGFTLFGTYLPELTPIESRMYEETYTGIKGGREEAIRFSDVLDKFAIMMVGRSIGEYFCYPDPKHYPLEAIIETPRRIETRERLAAKLARTKRKERSSVDYFKTWLVWEHIDDPILLEPQLLDFLIHGKSVKKKDRRGNDIDKSAAFNGDSHNLMQLYHTFREDPKRALSHESAGSEEAELLIEGLDAGSIGDLSTVQSGAKHSLEDGIVTRVEVAG